MTHFLAPQAISLSSIDFGDNRFFLAPLDAISPDKDLLESIISNGILQAPLLQGLPSGRFRILSGFKRLHILRDLASGEPAFCYVLAANTEPVTLYRQLLTHRQLHRALSPLEQARFLTLINKDLSNHQAQQFYSRLGINGHSNVQRILRLLELSPATQIAIHDALISVRMAEILHHFSQKEQEQLVALIRHFQLGGSKQQQLLQMSLELQMRHNNSIRELLDTWQTENESGNRKKEEGSNKPQEAAALLGWLKKKCYPTLNEAETLFQNFVASLNLPAHITVDHTPAFEDDRLVLKITCKDQDACRQVLTALTTYRQE